MVERHGNTLLPQYLGMYRLTVDGIQSYFVVMRNVFSSHLKVHKKYDLKGSTVDREANEKELEKQLPTLKDNDFIKNQVKINVGDSAKEKLTETLNADVDVSGGEWSVGDYYVVNWSLMISVAFSSSRSCTSWTTRCWWASTIAPGPRRRPCRPRWHAVAATRASCGARRATAKSVTAVTGE